MPNQVPMPEAIRQKISASKKGNAPLAAILSRRNFEKWPHAKGRRCACAECGYKRHYYYVKLKS